MVFAYKLRVDRKTVSTLQLGEEFGKALGRCDESVGVVGIQNGHSVGR
jgi:hypothetical protein